MRALDSLESAYLLLMQAQVRIQGAGRGSASRCIRLTELTERAGLSVVGVYPNSPPNNTSSDLRYVKRTRQDYLAKGEHYHAFCIYRGSGSCFIFRAEGW